MIRIRRITGEEERERKNRPLILQVSSSHEIKNFFMHFFQYLYIISPLEQPQKRKEEYKTSEKKETFATQRKLLGSTEIIEALIPCKNKREKTSIELIIHNIQECSFNKGYEIRNTFLRRKLCKY